MTSRDAKPGQKLDSNPNPKRKVWRGSASPRNGKFGVDDISHGPECGRERKESRRRREGEEKENWGSGFSLAALLIAFCVWLRLAFLFKPVTPRTIARCRAEALSFWQLRLTFFSLFLGTRHYDCVRGNFCQ